MMLHEIKTFMMVNVTITLPVYNEEEIIIRNTEKLIQFLDELKLNLQYEILIVDNGSNDSTKEKGEFLEKKFPQKVRFFHLEKKGVGLAFKKAIQEAKHGNLISLDMDISTDLTFIPECLKLLETESIVIGSKKLGSQERTLFRKTASNIFIYLVKLLLGLDFHDYSIGAKGYKKEDIIEEIKGIDNGSSYVVELIYFVKAKGKRLKEIPVYCHDVRKSKFNILNEAIYRFKNLMKLWLQERVL